MTHNQVFRGVSLVVLMAALILLYRVHPIAGWATLTVLAAGAIVARRRKARAALAA